MGAPSEHRLLGSGFSPGVESGGRSQTTRRAAGCRRAYALGTEAISADPQSSLHYLSVVTSGSRCSTDSAKNDCSNWRWTDPPVLWFLWRGVRSAWATSRKSPTRANEARMGHPGMVGWATRPPSFIVERWTPQHPHPIRTDSASYCLATVKDCHVQSAPRPVCENREHAGQSCSDWLLRVVEGELLRVLTSGL